MADFQDRLSTMKKERNVIVTNVMFYCYFCKEPITAQDFIGTEIYEGQVICKECAPINFLRVC